jgi:hypothetical protein
MTEISTPTASGLISEFVVFTNRMDTVFVELTRAYPIIIPSSSSALGTSAPVQYIPLSNKLSLHKNKKKRLDKMKRTAYDTDEDEA